MQLLRAFSELRGQAAHAPEEDVEALQPSICSGVVSRSGCVLALTAAGTSLPFTPTF